MNVNVQINISAKIVIIGIVARVFVGIASI